MKKYFTLLLCCASLFAVAQNIDYESYISQFSSSNCGNDPGFNTIDEHTWKGWISDNVNTIETFSSCITRDVDGPAFAFGNFAFRSRFNVTSTQLRARIDAWENDKGGRCDFDGPSFFSPDGDDCRANQACTYALNNPLEDQWTNGGGVCGTADYNLNLIYRYRYHTVTIDNGVDNTIQGFTGGGNKPFWGSTGSWSTNGGDCAVSGTIGDGQVSSFSTTVTCKDQVTFQWRTSSEANADWLEVYINGVLRDRISGITGWTSRTFNLDFGDNTVEWRYVKDGANSIGDDRAFVDNVVFLDAFTIDPGDIDGNQEVCQGGNPSSLNSISAAQAYSTFTTYQWEVSINFNTWNVIGGARNLSYNPPSGIAQTSYYRRRVQDACGNVFYSDTITVQVNPLPNGNLGNPPPICLGDTTELVFNGTVGDQPFDVTYNGQAYTGLRNGQRIPVSPPNTTNYNIMMMTDSNGCTRSFGFGIPTTVIVNTFSTEPEIAQVRRLICPGNSVTLTASGGNAGSGSSIRWYSGPNGTGNYIGAGNFLTVTPLETTTYYARREGICNTTPDDDEEVRVREIIYAPLGVTPAVDYCTDNNGWQHFFDANDDIIFSVQGDLTGASSLPALSITNNGTYYQNTLGAVGQCSRGWSPGEERFELPRAWNLDFNGTLNPPYTIRYYYPKSEQTTMEDAAIVHMASDPACGYTYKYPSYQNGFYWFKNVGASYVPPTYDQPTKLTATNDTTPNGIHYAEIPNINGFSGGSGGIILVPLSSLPVELVQFTAWNNGAINTLQWVTESELNNDRFEVQRSSDGQNFENIGLVKGAGTSLEVLTYLWEDQAPLMGVNYYRLRQVDLDGTESFSDIVAVVVNSDIGEARFFPNPVTNRLTYQFNAAQNEELIFRLTDVLGREMATWTHNTLIGINTKVLDMKPFPAGTYLMTVYQKDGTPIQSEHLVKQQP